MAKVPLAPDQGLIRPVALDLGLQKRPDGLYELDAAVHNVAAGHYLPTSLCRRGSLHGSSADGGRLPRYLYV